MTTSVTPEPTRADVLDWLSVHPSATQGEAVVALWGRLPDADHRRVAARVRKWVERARDDGQGFRQGHGPRTKPRPGTAAPPPPRAPSAVTPSVVELVGMERIPFLEAELARLQQDLDDARRNGELRLVPQLSRRAAETREALDDARATQARQGIKLDRSVAAVAAAVKERQVLIDRLAEKAGEG